MTSKFASPVGKQHAKSAATSSLDVRLDPKSLLGMSGDLSLASTAIAGSDASTHLRDICMAHVITSLADRTIGNPGLMLQRLLDFAPTDYDDLLLALAESGCSYVDILAAYIHNLRVVAQDNASQRGAPQGALVSGITEKFNDLLSEISKASHVASPNPKRRQPPAAAKQRGARNQSAAAGASELASQAQPPAGLTAAATTPRAQGRPNVAEASSSVTPHAASSCSGQAPSAGTPHSTSSAGLSVHSALQQPQISGEALSEKSVASTSSTTPLTQQQQQQQAPSPAQHLVFFPGAASSNPMHDMHAGLLLPGMADMSTPPPSHHHAHKLRSYWSENLEDARYSHGSADLPSLMQSPHPHPLRTSHDFSTPSSGVGMSAFQSPLSQHPVPEDTPSATPEEYHQPGSTTDQYMAELAAAAMQIQLPPMQPQLMLLPNGMPFALSPAAAAAAAAAANGGAEMSVLQLSEDMYCGAGALGISQMSSMLSVGSSHAEPLASFQSLPWNSIWQ